MRDPDPASSHVQTADQFAALLQAVQARDVVVLDTEFIPEGNYEPRLCLLQLATADGVWIVDPFALPDLTELWRTLTDPARELVVVAGGAEIKFCLRGARRPPARLLDLQVAAGLLGYGYPLSHTRLVQRVLDVHVKGGESFTDWTNRPLTPRQVKYATDDVAYLLRLRERLLAEARDQDRTSWIEMECRRLVERVASGDVEEGWHRVPGSSSLDRRELAILRELWRWRDQTARRVNRPSRTVLPDHLMLAIARRRPSTLDDMHALRGMSRVSIRKAGPEILDAVQRGMSVSDAHLPTRLRRDDPPQVGVLAHLLAAVTQTLAAQHRVDPTLLATSANLQELVRWRLGLAAREAKPWVLEGWRGGILGQALLDVLDGRRHIRVADVKSKSPLALSGDGAPTP